MEFLFEAGGFPRALAHEVELRAADLRMALDHYLVDTRGSHQEGTLDTNTIAGHAADGEIGIVATLAQADDRALEFLDTFSVAFLDFYVYTHHIAGAKLGDILVSLGF